MAAAISLAGADPARARAGLVLVHGRGATADGILDLGHALGLPDLALVAPQAPGMTWWPTSFLAPTAQMEPFVDRGMAAIDTAIAMLVDKGVPSDGIALAGFSQGGCLALEYAARRGGLAAVFGLSAGLVGTGDADGGPQEALYGFGPKAFDYATRLDGTPVEITVHERDPHIPLKRAEDSEAVFARLGARARLTVTPGAGHGIGPEAVAAMRGHLNV
ncbi:dienelactone hydrolase family protein [Roseibacterium sp. SDUM158017]|uniref:alpha/beta hydrolase n=1 Tax=Roseicyclus salinarum TaxID=3036773 RepID=UPI002414E37A|nr:dienelactone hydrolase family protein [Roseibacterium sp. SDUM158017]MDG4647197.1 dienelactone hydrolase family protein [Roseibacterium sp. SDUM158017]